MKYFRLIRNVDIHGNSGTGCVFTGVIFKSGKAVYMWSSEIGTVTVADSITQIENLHEHSGKGKVEIFDPEKYTSLKDLEKFLDGEPIDSLKLKKKYQPAKEEEETNE